MQGFTIAKAELPALSLYEWNRQDEVGARLAIARVNSRSSLNAMCAIRRRFDLHAHI
jgi:hypothetical protein